MQLFYNATINETTETFTFDREESKHIIKVLRKKDEDILFVTNGLGFLFTTKIILASDSKCTVEIVSFEKASMPKLHLHLAVAPTKMNDRYEWFLEKATEIGIQESLLDAGDRALIAHLQHNIATVSAMDSMPTVESADGGFCLDHDYLEAPRLHGLEHKLLRLCETRRRSGGSH